MNQKADPSTHTVIENAQQNIPCIECSIDGGKTWSVWVYFHSSQQMQAEAALSRLKNNYREWIFRIAFCATTENPCGSRTYSLAYGIKNI